MLFDVLCLIIDWGKILPLNGFKETTNNMYLTGQLKHCFYQNDQGTSMQHLFLVLTTYKLSMHTCMHHSNSDKAV